MNSAFIAGFLDELSKLGMEQFEKRMLASKKEHERRLSDIFSKKVPAKIEAAMRRRFPEVHPAKPKLTLPAVAKTASVKDTVSHPIAQTIGYAALAGEGARRLLGKTGSPKLRKAYRSKWGRRARLGTLGVGSAFLAAEAFAALGGVFSKKQEKKAGKGPNVIIKVQQAAPSAPKIRMGKVPKLTGSSLLRLSKAIGFKR